MKMPAESSIYWDSVGSQRSTSGGSSGDAYSSGSASRHYVDPWDLENYAYLRRHSVAGLTQQASRRHRRPEYRISQEARAHSEYWYSSSAREPGYHAPAFVEDLYCGPPRPANNSYHYHRPIYEDEVPDYAAPFPVYAPLSEGANHGGSSTTDERLKSSACCSNNLAPSVVLPRVLYRTTLEVRQGEFVEDHRRLRHNDKSTSMRDLQRPGYVNFHPPPVDVADLDIPQDPSRADYRSMETKPEREDYMVQIVPPPHLDLNTYGHLKIDYTNSWNSLNRKISK